MNTMENTLSLPAASGRKTLPRSARAVLALLEGIEHGRLEVRLPDGGRPCFGQAAAGQRAAVLEVAEWSVFDQVLERGDVGFAEAWIDGDWQSPDLTALLTLLAENRQALSRAVYGHWWGLLSARLRHLLNANTRSGARRNIMAHYDLGNDFYGQWLDPTMSYSSALYSTDAPRSMAAAQRAKYRRILHRLDARPGELRPDQARQVRQGLLHARRVAEQEAAVGPGGQAVGDVGRRHDRQIRQSGGFDSGAVVVGVLGQDEQVMQGHRRPHSNSSFRAGLGLTCATCRARSARPVSPPRPCSW
ncbi:MAG: class I SAM-dependent methyltransferase, partial [Candidatus Accumulibacter sp.]|uniref:class I SAM-dependent methyltransferase n=1 Tax=Accumulibacter sp. TaxID=2053492 RepID=UPI001B264CDD